MSPDFEVLGVRPTKKGSAVLANAWVRFFDALDLQLKVVEGPDGLFVALPVGEYKANGRTYYVRRARWADRDLREEVEEAVLDAYEALQVARVA